LLSGISANYPEVSVLDFFFQHIGPPLAERRARVLRLHGDLDPGDPEDAVEIERLTDDLDDDDDVADGIPTAEDLDAAVPTLADWEKAMAR
jgi:hypothetical protein